MQDQHSVITTAVDGIGTKVAEIYGLSVGRLYQILEADNYGKTRRLIRAVASIDKDRAKLIKADLDALFCEVLEEVTVNGIDAADLHSELNDVIHARLKNLPRDVRLRECWQAVNALNAEIQSLEKIEITEQNFGDLGKVN